MLVTPQQDRHNRHAALALAAVTAACGVLAGWAHPVLFLTVPLSGLVYWRVRRRIRRRLAVMKAPSPPHWEAILRTHVIYFNALDDGERDRFRQLVKIFLDEVRITGIGTEVDDLCRVLVAASAIIPVFGFPDWEYAGLGEVLIYPQAFGEDYHAAHEGGPVILGMVGAGHLHGVMVLSKPDLIAGFDNPGDKHNVGIHEFAHLVDEADGAIDGLPPGVPPALARSWVAFVARQLQHPPKGRSHINRYGYTNQAELFAVLAEYFFKSPEVLARKDAKLYDMLRQMFHQDTRTLLSHALPAPRRRLGRNSPCPCGSGKKYKHCCLAARAAPAA